jgi:hypothetical protein
VTEIVTDTLTLVPKLTLLTLSGHVESTTYVLSTPGDCIRLTGLSANSSFVAGPPVRDNSEHRKSCWMGGRGYPLPCFLEVLILHDFKSLSPEVLILRDFKCLFLEVLILVGLKSFIMSEMWDFAKILEVLILGGLREGNCENGGI